MYEYHAVVASLIKRFSPIVGVHRMTITPMHRSEHKLGKPHTYLCKDDCLRAVLRSRAQNELLKVLVRLGRELRTCIGIAALMFLTSNAFSNV